MSDPILTSPPAAPQPTDDKSTFNTRAFSFFGWFASFITEMQAAINWISEKSTQASTDAFAASQSATQAGASATSANQSKVAAAKSESAALNYAQAAGASAGVPTPAPNKVLSTDANGLVGWGAVPSDETKLDKSGGLATALGYKYKNHGTVAAAAMVTVNAVEATVHRIQASGTLTLVFSNLPSGVSTDLELLCVNFGGKTITWPTGSWIKSDGSYVAAVGNSGVTWQTAGTDRVLVMIDNGAITYKVMR